MSLVMGIIIILIIVVVTAHTLSYAIWNWRHDNKTGSVMIALISLASVVLPAYIVFFKT